MVVFFHEVHKTVFIFPVYILDTDLGFSSNRSSSSLENGQINIYQRKQKRKEGEEVAMGFNEEKESMSESSGEW